MRCIFAPKANSDLEEIADFIARDNPRRAESFIGDTSHYCQSITLMPQAYPLQEYLGEGIRRTCYGRYLIFYTVSSDEIRIERILHSARDIDGQFFIGTH